MDLRGGESFLSASGHFFPKRQLLGDNLERLRISGRDISEMITNRGNSRPIGQPWLSIYTVGIKTRSHSTDLQAAHKERHS